MKETSVLFVCLGNICRSPTAEGVFTSLLDKEGLRHVIRVDSAGTSGWHIGVPPDARTLHAAASRGFDLSMLRGRQVTQADFENYDYILAMDSSNLDDLRALQPANFDGHLGLFLAFSEQKSFTDVPDPYYGEGKGFDLVLDLVEDASQGLLEHLKAR